MNPAAPPPDAGPRLSAAVGLLSAGVTAQQVALMAVLGWTHWHHFAYLVVAVALLGFGVAGTVLSLAREWLLAACPRLLPWLALGAAATMPLGVRLAQTEALAVDLPLVFADPRTAWRLVALCLLLFPPFFCSGLGTGLVLAAHARRAGRPYAASLAGAGAGGMAGLGFAAWLPPPHLPAAAAVFALGAALLLRAGADRSGRLAALPVAALVFTSLIAPGGLRSSQFKPISRALDLPGAHIAAERPGVHGWVQIVAAPALRPAPAVSLQFAGEIPRQAAVFVNGAGHGSLPEPSALANPRWLESTTDAAAFAVARPRRVLLLENGPGGWAALARRCDAKEITVVEPNRSLVLLLTGDAAPLAPEWRMPEVTLVPASGRAFLRRAGGRFDVIRFPAVGALGGSAGLASAGEQFLFTREAFAEAWNRLEPDGVIAATAWMDFPERNPLRLLATLAETLEAAGVAPRQHLAGVRGWATVTFLARRTPWDEAGGTALRRFCEEHGHDPLLLTDLRPEERATRHAWPNPAFFELVDRLVDGPRGEIYRTHAFALRPAVDDRPYFSQFLRPASLPRLAGEFRLQAVPFFELGSLVVALTFVVLAGLAVIGIVLPLLRLGWRDGPGKGAVLLYFGGLGAGFMLVEIGLILRAHAWLASPVAAAALVLTSLLVCSGAGSLWSDRWPATPRNMRRAAATVAGLCLLVTIASGKPGALAHAWPAAAQIALLLGLAGGTGVVMGTAFPLGLRWLGASAPAHVPWAWAVNGCVSVATPAGAMLLAMGAGFGALFLAAAAAYALALLGALLARTP